MNINRINYIRDSSCAKCGQRKLCQEIGNRIEIWDIYIYIYKERENWNERTGFSPPLKWFNSSSSSSGRKTWHWTVAAGVEMVGAAAVHGNKGYEKENKNCVFFLFVAKENNEITIRNDNIVGSKVIWSASLLIFLFSWPTWWTLPSTTKWRQLSHSQRNWIE